MDHVALRILDLNNTKLAKRIYRRHLLANSPWQTGAALKQARGSQPTMDLAQSRPKQLNYCLHDRLSRGKVFGHLRYPWAMLPHFLKKTFLRVLAGFVAHSVLQPKWSWTNQILLSYKCNIIIIICHMQVWHIKMKVVADTMRGFPA